jgi:regulator of sirC expression with transglutaminase-like and TPR domain
MKLGRFADAVQDLTQAITLDPGDGRLYRDRGECYRALGDLTSARRDEQTACRRGFSAACSGGDPRQDTRQNAARP